MLQRVVKRRARVGAYSAYMAIPSKKKKDKQQDKAIMKLNAAVHSEYRQFTYILGTTGIDNVPNCQLLIGNMTRGDTSDGYSGGTTTCREGNRITIWGLELRYRIQNDGAAASTNCTDNIRAVLVRDKQANGGSPTTATMFNNNGSAANNNLAPYNRNYLKRYKFLMDRMHNNIYLKPNTRQAVGATTWDAFDHCYKFKKRFKKGLVIQYAATNAGDITDIVSNSIYFYLFGHTATTYADGSALCTIYFTP